MAGVLYLSARCKYSKQLLRDLYETQNRDFQIVNVDIVDRWSLPQAVTGVPMALLPDGRTLMGQALFRTIQSRPVVAGPAAQRDAPPPPEPEAVGLDGYGAFLDADVAEKDPQSFLDQYFVNIDAPQDEPIEKKTINLDELQQARMNDINHLQR